MARQSDARERLIRAAVKLFRRRGYDGVGLTEILAEAKTPKGSFYHHFPDGKEQLGAEALAAAGAVVAGLVASAFEKASIFEEGVFRIAEAISEGFERSSFRDGCPIASIAFGSTPQSARLASAARAALHQWQELIMDQAARLGEADFSNDDALALIVLLEGGWIVSRMRGDSAPLRQAAVTFAASRRRAGDHAA